MSDEQTPTGESVEPVQEEVQEQPVQEPTQQPGELDVLKQQISNLETKLGEQGNELGNLRNENAYYRSQGQPQSYPQSPMGGQIPQGSDVGSMPEEEYDPYDQKSVDKYFAKKQQAIDARLSQFAQYQQQVQMGSAINSVKQVIQSNPDYFKGVEDQTLAMVSNLGQTGQVNPNLLADPSTVYGCADMIKGQQARSNPQPVMPMAPTSIDTPSQAPVQSTGQTVNNEIPQEVVDRLYGGDRQKATELTRKAQEERLRSVI